MHETNDKDNISSEDKFVNHEEADDTDSLEKRKVEYMAQGNIGQNQVFIQNLYGAVSDVLQKSSPICSEDKDKEKNYDLRDKNNCIEFIEKYKNSQYLAVAIILATFELVALGDLPDLEEQLMEYLPNTEFLDNDEKKTTVQWNPYISLNTILSIICGKRFEGKDGRSYTGLGEGTEQALVNILEQFPILRRGIIEWLIHLHETYHYHTSFDAYQITTAFARVISIDISDANTRIFPWLYTNPDNTGLLGNLVYRLYRDLELRKDIEAIILQWIKSDGIWLWKPACMAFAFLTEDGYQTSFETILLKRIESKILQMEGRDLNFIARLQKQYKSIRTIFARALNNVYHRADSREKRIGLSQIYINLVRRSYYQVDSCYIKLPLVTCDQKRQQEFLAPIICQVMSTYHLRKQLYSILVVYMEEISKYDFSIDLVNYLAAYFYNMASSYYAYQQDILCFLGNSTNDMARQVYVRLRKIYDKKELKLQ